MTGLATLSYVESYQVLEPVLLINIFDGVTATMVLSGSGPYRALLPGGNRGRVHRRHPHIGVDDRCARVGHHHRTTPLVYSTFL